MEREDMDDRLADTVDTFQRWLHLPDPDHVICALGAVAANLIHGDPLWILFVGAASSGKTEAISPLTVLPYVHSAGTLTEASFLSGSPKREVSKDSTGGLLRQMGDFGILLVKDFSGVLTMNSDTRNSVLSALREIFDGSWTRLLGTDGGKTLSWSGKCGFIGAVTPSIDRHSAVMGALGERFVLYRLADTTGKSKARRALGNYGHETQMRTALHGGILHVLDNIKKAQPDPLNDEEADRIVDLAEFVVVARTAVERDGYSRDVVVLPEAEQSPRLAKQLAQLRAGVLAIGADEETAWRIIRKAAVDSIPRIRWRILNALRDNPGAQKITDLVRFTDIPRKTITSHLEDMALLDLIDQDKADTHETSAWEYVIAEQVRQSWPDPAQPPAELPIPY